MTTSTPRSDQGRFSATAALDRLATQAPAPPSATATLRAPPVSPPDTRTAISALVGVPVMFDRLVTAWEEMEGASKDAAKRALASLRLARCGGGPCGPRVREAWFHAAGSQLQEFYGAKAAGPVLFAQHVAGRDAATAGGEGDAKAGMAGVTGMGGLTGMVPLPGVSVRLATAAELRGARAATVVDVDGEGAGVAEERGVGETGGEKAGVVKGSADGEGVAREMGRAVGGGAWAAQ